MTNEDTRTRMAHITLLKLLDGAVNKVDAGEYLVRRAVELTDYLLDMLERTAKKPDLYSEVSE